MRINFRQGLFKAERDDTGNALLVNQDQTALTARVSNSEIVWSIAQGSKNYTVSEFNPVVIAKIEDLQKHAECWVYVDLDRTKGHKTYGITAHAPIVDDKAPANPVEDQHWFNTATMKQQVYMEAARSWSERVRLIIGKWDGAAFKSAPFGTSVGVNVSAKSGIVIYDPVKKAIKDSVGQFVTTEDSIYFENGITHEFAIETNITTAEATEAVPAFAVVSFIDFDKVRLAQYEDTTNVVTAITLNSGATGEPLSLSLQGKIYNELWNWPEVNATLWVGENGQLTDRDPFDKGGVRVRRVPVARVIDKHTVLFAQGLGGVGADGDVRYFIATNAMIGSVRLSLEAAVPNDPVVVGDNDPRLIAKDASGIPVTDFADYVDVTVQEVLEDHDSEITALETSIDEKLALKVDVEAGKQLSAEDFTLELKTKLEHLEGSHYRGVFVSVDALEAITDAVAGDYADVDVVDTPTTRYIWDASDSKWTKQSGEVPALTATQVKQLYESNLNTNVYDDTAKAAVDGVTAKFDKADIAQATGTATDKVMSQKAVTDALSTLSTDKVDKDDAKQLSDENYTLNEKTKLANVGDPLRDFVTDYLISRG